MKNKSKSPESKSLSFVKKPYFIDNELKVLTDTKSPEYKRIIDIKEKEKQKRTDYNNYLLFESATESVRSPRRLRKIKKEIDTMTEKST